MDGLVIDITVNGDAKRADAIKADVAKQVCAICEKYGIHELHVMHMNALLSQVLTAKLATSQTSKPN